MVNCVWNIQTEARHQACNVIRKQLRAYTAVSATHTELSKGERSIVMTVSVCLWAYPWNYSVSPKTSTLCFWITLIFGMLNFEKIWRENLRDLSFSPVRCSHLLHFWEIQKNHFSTLLFIYRKKTGDVFWTQCTCPIFTIFCACFHGRGSILL